MNECSFIAYNQAESLAIYFYLDVRLFLSERVAGRLVDLDQERQQKSIARENTIHFYILQLVVG
jgi:hypothetical protein